MDNPVVLRPTQIPRYKRCQVRLGKQREAGEGGSLSHLTSDAMQRA